MILYNDNDLFYYNSSVMNHSYSHVYNLSKCSSIQVRPHLEQFTEVVVVFPQAEPR